MKRISPPSPKKKISKVKLFVDIIIQHWQFYHLFIQNKAFQEPSSHHHQQILVHFSPKLQGNPSPQVFAPAPTNITLTAAVMDVLQTYTEVEF